MANGAEEGEEMAAQTVEVSKKDRDDLEVPVMKRKLNQTT